MLRCLQLPEPCRLQEALLDLGGFYVKTGQANYQLLKVLTVLTVLMAQVLSTRVDLFSKPFRACTFARVACGLSLYPLAVQGTLTGYVFCRHGFY